MKIYISEECRVRAFFLMGLGIVYIIIFAWLNYWISGLETDWGLWGIAAFYELIIALLVYRDKYLMGYCVVSGNMVTMYRNKKHSICSVDLSKPIYYDVIMLHAAPSIRKEFIVISNSLFEPQTKLKDLYYLVKSAVKSKNQIVMPYDNETRKICPVWKWKSVRSIGK